MTAPKRARLEVRSTWNGAPLEPAEWARCELGWEGDCLAVAVEAPYYGDAPPDGPPGPTKRLWEHEVVELFLLEEPDHYLEIELGPHGHHLVLELRGVRRAVRTQLPIDYQARIVGRRWRGVARVAGSLVPPRVARANAYAIHGQGPTRAYAACFPVPGDRPDFHRLERFGPIAWSREP